MAYSTKEQRLSACNKFVDDMRKKGWSDRRITRAALKKFNVKLVKEEPAS